MLVSQKIDLCMCQKLKEIIGFMGGGKAGLRKCYAHSTTEKHKAFSWVFQGYLRIHTGLSTQSLFIFVTNLPVWGFFFANFYLFYLIYEVYYIHIYSICVWITYTSYIISIDIYLWYIMINIIVYVYVHIKCLLGIYLSEWEETCKSDGAQLWDALT